MTYKPTAYVIPYEGKHWIVLRTPSGLTARLATQYSSKAGAEAGIVVLGFELVERPTPHAIDAN